MSQILDMARSVIGSSLDFLADTYIVTVDPQGTAASYTCRGWLETDFEGYREQGLAIEQGDAVVGLLASQSPTLTDISPGDYVQGPTDANNLASKKGIVRDVVQDPAAATWIVSLRNYN